MDAVTRYQFEAPGPAGFASRPYFIEQLSHEHADGVEVHLFENFGGESLRIGSGGLQSEGKTPESGEVDAAIPSDGWAPTKVQCWQTGGMCMVDVVYFENGWLASITDESVLLWRNLDECSEGLGYVEALWLC